MAQGALLTVALVLGVCAAGQSEKSVEGGVTLPPPTFGVAPRDVDVVLTLHGGEQRLLTGLRPDGSFAFHGVPPGSHQLHVACVPLVYNSYIIEVSHAGNVRFILPDSGTELPLPVWLEPIARAQYTEPPAFTLKSIISNPMYLMIGASLVGMLLLPRMIENMDPQELESMKQQMGSSAGGTASGQTPGLMDLISGKTSLAEMSQQMQQQLEQQQSQSHPQQRGRGGKSKHKSK
jgi:hypothetical protein